MTMPIGSTEEPDVTQVMGPSIPVHVVSTGGKKERNVGAEFGRWRTYVVAPTSGGQRILNRSLRRKRAIIKINASVAPAGGTTAAAVFNTATGPGAGAVIATTGILPAGTYTINWTVGYGAGAVTQATEVNNMQLNAGAITLRANVQGVANSNAPQPNVTVTLAAPAAITVTAINAGTATAVYEASITATQSATSQTPTDGVFLVDRDTANNVGQSFALPGFQYGGLLQIGDNARWECQQELHVVPAAGNSATVYVTVSDEIYASGEEA